MNNILHLSPYRRLLYVVAAIGFFGINGVFVFYMLFNPDLMVAALKNPISLVFILEAFLMTGFIAWLIAVLGFKKPGWGWFVGLSMLGGLGFSVPSFLLMQLRNAEKEPDMQHA